MTKNKTDNESLLLLEAILFASPDPIEEKVLAERLPGDVKIKDLLKELSAHYQDRGINLTKVGKGWAFRTNPDLMGALVREREVSRKLSRAAIETLAIAAYHQPVSRPEIEEIRGVTVSAGTVDLLFEMGWIEPKGRRETPGRPMTWGTTEVFLDHFGIDDVKDLPGVEELRETGLLDTRPSAEAYSVHADMNRVPEDIEQDAPDEEMPEPLDPDGGGDEATGEGTGEIGGEPAE